MVQKVTKIPALSELALIIPTLTFLRVRTPFTREKQLQEKVVVAGQILSTHFGSAFACVSQLDLREALCPHGQPHRTMDEILRSAATLSMKYVFATVGSESDEEKQLHELIDALRNAYTVTEEFVRTRSICAHIVHNHLRRLREVHDEAYDLAAQRRNTRGMIARLSLQWPDFGTLDVDATHRQLFAPEGNVDAKMAAGVTARLSVVCGAFWDAADEHASEPFAKIEDAFHRSMWQHPIGGPTRNKVDEE